MKLYLTAKNSSGKRQGLGDNEAIDIMLQRGNDIVAELTYLDGLLILKRANPDFQFSLFPKSQKRQGEHQDVCRQCSNKMPYDGHCQCD